MQTKHAVQMLFPAVLAIAPAFAQAPYFRPEELDRVVSRVALYPDPLLAQVMAAATYSNDIPEAARWADQHHYLAGDALADAIRRDQLPWDPSVQALLPFPSVLQMMASDINWTRQLGDAFLSQEQDVMEAVQRLRQRARGYGYLRSSRDVIVSGGSYVEILPARPDYLVVPYYDPALVFVAPRPGFFVGGAIRFGYGISIGAAFRPWGWGYNRFDWGGRTVIINNNPWRRTWVDRDRYAHPYEGLRREGPVVVRPAEQHRLEERSPRERQAPERGERAPREQHRGDDRRR